jgi:hypothetical protein
MAEPSPRGLLIVNADDWGRDARTTDSIFDCLTRKSVSAVSAMVFMEDSERAAEVAGGHTIDAGLHLNFTSPFTARLCPTGLASRQRDIAAYLLRHRLAQVVFNPTLVTSFEYVVSWQLDEFHRIYGVSPARLDGHHHMHLCANVLLCGLLPLGTLARRNFSFRPGEKGVINRTYRSFVDRVLARRHRLVDRFFSLAPLDDPAQIRQIFFLARQHVVEVETHPVQLAEYCFLTGGEFFRQIGDVRLGPPSVVLWPGAVKSWANA